jgi:hypothetical protein
MMSLIVCDLILYTVRSRPPSTQISVSRVVPRGVFPLHSPQTQERLCWDIEVKIANWIEDTSS